jgi:tripartite-type tricarboxylate transporter receptor subunit TctC
MVQVSYRDFGPALQDVSEGRINVVSTGLLPMLPLAQSGKVRLLVITNSRRSPAAPDIPTAKEAGFPELAVDGFQGFFGWRGIPDELRDRIAADVRAVAADPEIEKRLNELGQAVRTGSTADFVTMIKEQRAKITSVVQAIGLQPQ